MCELNGLKKFYSIIGTTEIKIKNMHFITKKKSETGKKFQKIAEVAIASLKAEKALAKEFGFESWRGAYWHVYGGFSALIFKVNPNERIYRKVNGNEWMPRMTTKEGKAIQAKLDSTPRVSINELNQCIGFDGAPFKTIGFAQNNDNFFGFIVDEKWKVKIPKDCEEVTTSRYNELFKTVGKKNTKKLVGKR